MALAVDASSPVAVRTSGATTTTASFTPPANAAYVAFVQADANNGSTETCTVSGGGLAWSLARRHNGSPGATAEIWTAYSASAPGPITVSVTSSQGAVAKSLFVRVFTGADPTVLGTGFATGASASLAYLSSSANSWAWSCCLGDFPGAIGAGTGVTIDDSVGSSGFDGGDGIASFHQTATTPVIGTTVTNAVTGGVSVLHHVMVEVIPLQGTPAATVPTVRTPPRRSAPLLPRRRPQPVPSTRRIPPQAQPKRPRPPRKPVVARSTWPPAVQAPPPPPVFVYQPRTKAKGILARRSVRPQPVPRQAMPPQQPRRPVPKLILPKRRRSPDTPPAQVQPPPATWLTQAVRQRLRAARMPRTWPQTPIPQLAPPPPVYPPARPRQVLRMLAGRRAKPAVTPPPQQIPPVVARRKPVMVVRRKQPAAQFIPPQLPVIPTWPRQPRTYRRILLWRRRRNGSDGWLIAGITITLDRTWLSAYTRTHWLTRPGQAAWTTPPVNTTYRTHPTGAHWTVADAQIEWEA